jgi:hypothetical protein
LPEDFTKKNFCILDYPEDAYKSPLSAFVIMHILVYFIAKFFWILHQNYKQMMTNGNDRLFAKTYPKAAGILVVIYSITIAVSWFLKGQVKWDTESGCSYELRA